MAEETKVCENNVEVNGSQAMQAADAPNAQPAPSESRVGGADEKTDAQNVNEATEGNVVPEQPGTAENIDVKGTDAECSQEAETQPAASSGEPTQGGKDVLNKLEGVEATVAKGQELADANREAILAAVADVKNDLLKKISALKGSTDTLLSGQKEINREFREASETAVLNAILGIYREMDKAVARAQENPDTALEEVNYCRQLVEDALFNLGIVKYEPEVGVDSYDARSGKQKLLSVVPTGDESLNQKIAEVVYPGFLRDDRGFSDLGKAWVKVYRFDPKLADETKSEE